MAGVVPPFTQETAEAKVKAAQNLWNSQDPVRVAAAYTPDCIWRNRDSFFRGTAAIEDFLKAKWAREREYRLRKELFAWGPDRIAVQFWYEFRDGDEPGMPWKRAYGIEHWTFAPDGRMRKRQMSANNITLIDPESRWFRDGVDVNTVPISEDHW